MMPCKIELKLNEFMSITNWYRIQINYISLKSNDIISLKFVLNWLFPGGKIFFQVSTFILTKIKRTLISFCLRYEVWISEELLLTTAQLLIVQSQKIYKRFNNKQIIPMNRAICNHALETCYVWVSPYQHILKMKK